MLEHVGCIAADWTFALKVSFGKIFFEVNSTESIITSFLPVTVLNSDIALMRPSVHEELSLTIGMRPPSLRFQSELNVCFAIDSCPARIPFEDQGVEQHKSAMLSGVAKERPAFMESEIRAFEVSDSNNEFRHELK